MRLIDADELLRKLEEYFNKKEQDAKFTGNRGSEVSWNDAIYYIRTAPSAQPEHNPDDERKIADLHKIVNYLLSQQRQQWIPCSERLPDDYTDVLVWFEYFRYGDYNCLYQTYGIGDYSTEYDSWMINHETGWHKLRVIAWMPLPEPYREKGEQDALNKSEKARQETQGVWLKISPAGIYECSKCHQHVMTNDITSYRFCHGCGLRMSTQTES